SPAPDQQAVRVVEIVLREGELLRAVYACLQGQRKGNDRLPQGVGLRGRRSGGRFQSLLLKEGRHVRMLALPRQCQRILPHLVHRLDVRAARQQCLRQVELAVVGGPQKRRFVRAVEAFDLRALLDQQTGQRKVLLPDRGEQHGQGFVVRYRRRIYIRAL